MISGLACYTLWFVISPGTLWVEFTDWSVCFGNLGLMGLQPSFGNFWSFISWKTILINVILYQLIKIIKGPVVVLICFLLLYDWAFPVTDHVSLESMSRPSGQGYDREVKVVTLIIWLWRPINTRKMQLDVGVSPLANIMTLRPGLIHLTFDLDPRDLWPWSLKLLSVVLEFFSSDFSGPVSNGQTDRKRLLTALCA